MTNYNERRIREITYDLYRLQDINRILAENREGEYEREILYAEKEKLESEREENKRELQQLLEQTNNIEVMRDFLQEIF